MKITILSVAVATALLGALPATAGEFGAGSRIASFGLTLDPAQDADVFERRGRGRGGDDDRRGERDDDDDRRGGRGGHSPNDDDDDRRGGRGDDDDDSAGNGGDGHGGRPRIPGGSGCDDPGDVAEHAECRA